MIVSREWRRFGAMAPLLIAALLAACSSTPKEDENSPRAVERLYAEAHQDMLDGNYEAATKGLERVEGRGAGTLLSQQATLELAYISFKTGERAQAISTLDRFIKLHPTSPALDYALYLRGIVNFNDNRGILGNLANQDLAERDQQASRDAHQSFKQLVDQFPNSKYAPDARARMDFIVNSLAAYEVHVADYYYRRGAFLAAANRAQQSLQEFPQTPSNEQALAILVRSYDRLGLTQLRDDADRVLKLNYPNSRFLDDSGRGGKRPWWQLW